ncbi:hypothetical protein HG530_002019 [Fusarium avenaceum]|nr:hypothetical protein HG530_002019 [Fusarium avenaceum]
MNNSNARHGGHPSDSIPDAAYPNDAPYRTDGASPQTMNHTPTSPSPQYSPPSHFGASINPPAPSSPWSPTVPQSPPPPYDPSRPPAIYSPLAPPPLSSPPPQYPPSTPWPDSVAGSSVHGAPYKMGAAAQARRRRKMQILALLVCAVIIFFFSLIMGILMGVVKVQWRDNHDD